MRRGSHQPMMPLPFPAQIVKIRVFVAILVLAHCSLTAQPFSYDWARRYGSTSRDAAQGVALDHQGGVYWTGENYTPGMNSEIRVMKLYTAQGGYQWELILGSEGYDAGTSVEVRIEQGEPYVYVLGCFSETVDFDPGPDVAEFTSHGATDVFVAKYDGNGDYVQAWTFGDHADDYGLDLALDTEGHIYVAGIFHGQMDVDPGPDTLYLTAQFGFDAFVVKLDSGGHAVFAASAGGAGYDQGHGVAVDPEGNVITTGYFSGVATFASPDTSFSHTSQGAEDAYLWKLDPQGETLWCHTFGAAGRDKGLAVTTDDQGNVYTGGEFAGTVDFDPGTDDNELTYHIAWDAFVQKLSPTGDFIWARPLLSFVTTVRDLAWDGGTDRLFCTGSFGGQLDLGTAVNPVSLNSVGNDDVFLAIYDASSGQILGAASIGGNQRDRGLAVTPDGWGNVYLAGFFHYTADFDPGPSVQNYTSYGQEEAFVVKWKDQYTGINHRDAPLEMSVYPSPARNVIHIRFPGGQNAEVTIYDLSGRVSYRGVLYDEITRISTAGFAPGMYLVRVKDERGMAVKKLVVG